MNANDLAQDASKETRYYNDLWVYDLEELKWSPVEFQPGMSLPSSRGGCQLGLHAEAETLYIIGGYSVKHSSSSDGGITAPHGKLSARKQAQKTEEEDDDGKGIVHDDVWALSLTSWRWERVKKAGMAPSRRTSFGLGVHKQRAIIFGGVFDREGAGDRLYSELFNELYQFNFLNRRWYPVALKAPKAASKKKGHEGEAASGEDTTEKENENDGSRRSAAGGAALNQDLKATLSKLASSKDSSLLRAAVKIQAAFRGHAVRKAYHTYRMGGQISELLYSPAAYGIDLSDSGPKPRARSAPMVTVLKNKMWVWGGIVEISHNDVVLDDLWSLDLSKLDGWRCWKENTAGEEMFRELSDWETDSD